MKEKSDTSVRGLGDYLMTDFLSFGVGGHSRSVHTFQRISLLIAWTLGQTHRQWITIKEF